MLFEDVSRPGSRYSSVVRLGWPRALNVLRDSHREPWRASSLADLQGSVVRLRRGQVEYELTLAEHAQFVVEPIADKGGRLRVILVIGPASYPFHVRFDAGHELDVGDTLPNTPFVQSAPPHTRPVPASPPVPRPTHPDELRALARLLSPTSAAASRAP